MATTINRKRRSGFSTLPEQVLCSSSHSHLLVNLLVDASSPVLKFTPLSLGKRITSLTEKWKIKRYRENIINIVHHFDSQTKCGTIRSKIVNYLGLSSSAVIILWKDSWTQKGQRQKPLLKVHEERGTLMNISTWSYEYFGKQLSLYTVCQINLLESGLECADFVLKKS